ncbi:MarR family transcriptional regulator with acetyltransferase activity [Roseibium hamelinense]|uniref:MarR family transcriptional regulator with acetyltransferase activity n=1 Tax=Roseibium hamelinense TaxID=150831 RepID=A0A562TA25_9HYPH|nr:bifunctional helix-turn-helix transcriptional regulator/GNAT family N-acetyltransferase [Roseibium hamelinense]MTI43516.1 GNAT family N-acetyltransferase [Roseibium hamelinense]TWI89690.1 MarR family transcriptional regulator with acetyltransferase activity [Roseibium hamelinense]
MLDVASDLVSSIRAASREMVRELGFLGKTIAGTDMSASAVHMLIEIGNTPGVTAKALSERLRLEKSSVSRMLKSLEKRGEISVRTLDTDKRASGLHLTDQGTRTYEAINAFGDAQVRGALSRLAGSSGLTVAKSLADYAAALSRTDERPRREPVSWQITEGYQTGMIGDIAAMHGRTHGAIVGTGPAFETVVAAGLSEFASRMDRPFNNSWSVVEDGRVVASISIDGEDLEGNVAHLRWFILQDRLRGKGLGRELLSRALAHVDELGFDETWLWTLKGLDPARRLYERNGFVLTDEYLGDQWGQEVWEQKFVRTRPA